MTDTPLIYAHRGFTNNSSIRENTMQSFRLAFQAGADGIETDVRKTRDNQLVCIHDESAETLGLPGLIGEYTHKELSEASPGGGESLPLLGEVLARFKHRMRFIIEIKEHDCEHMVVEQLLLQNVAIAEEQVIVSSFIPEVLYKIKLINPNISTALLVKSPAGSLKKMKAFRCDGVHPFFEQQRSAILNFLLPAGMKPFMKKAMKNGYQVIPWTVNNPKNMERLFAKVVSGIITDRPDIAVEVRQQFL
ncbi:MAG: hypothetical protein JW904_01370 [Spirochaetales bacterium]|nr:hypothetical protein [Spirochaetales bacterium]